MIMIGESIRQIWVNIIIISSPFLDFALLVHRILSLCHRKMLCFQLQHFVGLYHTLIAASPIPFCFCHSHIKSKAIIMKYHGKKQQFAYAKTKAQISFAVTAKLFSAFVFATRIIQFLYFLKPKFPASIHHLCLYILVCVGPVRETTFLPVFS